MMKRWRKDFDPLVWGEMMIPLLHDDYSSDELEWEEGLYTGSRVDGVPYGFGRWVSGYRADATVYEGDWVAGERTGHGVETVAGRIIFAGEWRENRPVAPPTPRKKRTKKKKPAREEPSRWFNRRSGMADLYSTGGTIPAELANYYDIEP